MPAPSLTFEGVSNRDNQTLFGYQVLPPDTNGDVGRSHYVQMVNNAYQVFAKDGQALMPPRKLSDLFAALGPPCGSKNHGDPVVLYDPLADRWILSQLCVMATPNYHELIAISQTGDPMGAYFLYDFMMPNLKFNDYPKFGVWPDAYYMTDNEFDFNSGYFLGGGVFAFDRAKMLVGDPSASFIYFDLAEVDPLIGGMLPSDMDGLTPPPRGTPNYMAYFTADEFGDPADRLRVFEFHADFLNPGGSSFTERAESPVPVAAFNPLSPPGRHNIPQPPPASMDKVQGLDALTDRLMHRLVYRNFGDHESLVVDHTVNVSGGLTVGTFQAGVRYYELRRPLPDGRFAVNEQATFAPDGDSRWMGSAAMDHDGNLAVGYSVSSLTTRPSIRYAGRLATDPPNGLYQGERTLHEGTFVQWNNINRWGDYSALTVDPVGDCTFWFTSEYYEADDPASIAEWQTRVGRFAFPSCTPASGGAVRGKVTDAVTGLPILGAVVRTPDGHLRVTNAAGLYEIIAAPGRYDLEASGPNLWPQVFEGLVVTEGGTTVQDFALEPHLVPLLKTAGVPGLVSETCVPGTGTLDPGETVSVTLGITNVGMAEVSNLTATLLPTGGVTDPGPPQVYGNVPADGSVVSRLFSFKADTGLTCGKRLTATLSLSDGGVDLGTLEYVVPVGGLGPPIPGAYGTGNLAVPIPDRGVVEVPIPVTEPGTIADVDIGIRLNHALNVDLAISLVHPDGTVVSLWRHGGSQVDRFGANFGDGPVDCSGRMAVFDDASDFFVVYSRSPFVSSAVRPVEPLGLLNGKDQAGVWKLRVADTGSGSLGTFGCADLRIVRERPLCCPFQGGSPAVVPAPPVSVGAESCHPANQAADRNEVVTVNFPLRNIGTGSATDLVATLLPGGGVLAPSPPQSFGVLGPVGPPVSRPFSFVPEGACGSDIVATLRLDDPAGAGPLGTVDFPIRIGGSVGYTQSYNNAQPVLISYARTGAGLPYPSTIKVSGITGTVGKVTVRLSRLSDPVPGAVQLLLVGPRGQKVVLMHQSGAGFPLQDATLTFDDAAATLLPIQNRIVSGTYRPTDRSGLDGMPAPAPAGPYGRPPSLAVFNRIDPNGVWSLYAKGIEPTTTGEPLLQGQIAGGWRLTITTSDPLCCNESCALGCPPTVSLASEPGACAAPVILADPGVSGSCGVVTCSPPSGSRFGLGTTTGACGGAAASGDPIASCGFDVTVTADTTTRVDPVTTQYSDISLLRSAVESPGCPTFSGLVQFLADGIPIGSVPASGTGTVTLPNQVLSPQGAHVLTADFTSATSGVLDSSGSSALSVVREDATVIRLPSDPAAFAVSGPGETAPVTLSAQIREVEDGSPGDIAKAVPVRFTLRPVLRGTSLLCEASAGSVSGGMLIASCTVPQAPVDVYDVMIGVGGDFYTGAGASVVTVYDPSLGSAQGDGSVLRQGVRGDFAFSLRYRKNGSIEGQLQYVEHRPTGDVVLRSQSMAGLSIVGATAVSLGTAELDGVPGFGFRLTAVDGGRTRKDDRFGLSVTDPSGAAILNLTFAPASVKTGSIKVGRN